MTPEGRKSDALYHWVWWTLFRCFLDILTKTFDILRTPMILTTPMTLMTPMILMTPHDLYDPRDPYDLHDPYSPLVDHLSSEAPKAPSAELLHPRVSCCILMQSAAP